MADAPKLNGNEFLDESYYKINMSIDNANEALKTAKESLTSPVSTVRIDPKAVTKEKLGDDVDYQTTALSGAIIGDNVMWEKVAAFGAKSNMTEEFIDNNELEFGKKLLKLTVTGTTNYKQLLSTETIEHANAGVKIPTYAKRYKKLSAALNYKITKAAGTASIQAGISVRYSDGTQQSTVMATLKADGKEYSETLEQEVDNTKTISRAYFYVRGGDLNDVIKISYASYWCGKTNDNIFDKTLLLSKIGDVNTSVVSLKENNRINWFADAKNIVQNKTLIKQGVSLESSNLFLQNGVKSLSINNAMGTPFWFEFECNSAAATPYFRFEIHELIKKLHEIKNSGLKLSKLRCSVELYFPYALQHDVKYKFLSKKTTGEWYYFPESVVTKGANAQKITLELNEEIDSIINTLGDYLALYITFASPLNTQKIYLGWMDIWVDDEKQVLFNENFNGSSIIPGTVIEQSLEKPLQDKINSAAITSTPKKQLRIAMTGSSITWGNGLLDEGFVREIDYYLRDYLSETYTHNSMAMIYSGANRVITNEKFYKKTARKLTGAESSVSFSFAGDELSIVQGIERSNKGAAIIELYVDGELYDSFSNYNTQPSGNTVVNAVGDGTTVKFDLGRSFTYGHVVKVNGSNLVGKINDAGSGATFPVGHDYMIIRKYGKNPSTQETEVHHILYFKTAPVASATIEVSMSYGENIIYTKSTIGETSESIESALESRYGDDVVSFDPANPSGLSSGLDFRETDERAVKTWKFTEYKKREFMLKIKDYDPRANKSDSPYFILNFVTNRMHHIMNAGIGGWTAEKLYNDEGLRNYHYLMRFDPDILFVESGTNDDWDTGNQFVATKTITNVTEATLRRYPTLWLKSSKYIAANNYTIETASLTIESVTRTSVKISGAGTDVANVKKGDHLIIGDYHFDEREVTARIIDTWDAATRTATFKKPLKPHEMLNIKTVNDLVGKTVMVKRIDSFISWLDKVVDGARQYNDDVQIGLVSTGLCAFTARLLIGYPEKIKELALQKKCSYANAFDFIKRWQYSQKKTGVAYLNTANNTTSTGAAEYNLVNVNGADSNSAQKLRGIRNYSVKVNGVERYGDGCYIDNAYGYYFKATTTAANLTIDNWANKVTSKIAADYVTTKLVFTKDIPPTGATIEVSFSTEKWSGDDCHMGLLGGEHSYKNSLIDAMQIMLYKSMGGSI